MNTRTLAIAAVGTVLTLGGLAPRPASAEVTWAIRHVTVPYTHVTWEDQVRYRTVRRAVTRTYYRREWTKVVTWRTVREWGAIWYTDRRGVRRKRYGWIMRRIPVETWVQTLVPYERTTYEYVREPYTVRVCVRRTAYRSERRRVAVRFGSSKFGVVLRLGPGSRPSWSVEYRPGGRHRSRCRPVYDTGRFPRRPVHRAVYSRRRR